MTTFDRIEKALNAAGIHAWKDVFTAGLYYDGQQHGELIPCVWVSVDAYDTNHERKPIERAIKNAIRNKPGITYREHNTNPYYYTYLIATRDDFARADELNRVSRTFLEAFWQEIHDNPNARDNNAEAARKAGQAAIREMKSA